MPIIILPESVASQIAAGEVVERPASVVKELLENALDAGAMFIEIHIQKAGRRSIEISDDGCGIPSSEIRLALARHATSKLSISQDLNRITTLGFRGEALASIGSVSRLTLTSRTPDSEAASQLQMDGGKISAVKQLGSPVGTMVRIEDLFYNLPARAKFLKSDNTERRHIDSVVIRYAIAFPKVRFQLYQDNKPVLQSSGNGDRQEILAQMYGVDFVREMLPINAQFGELTVDGFTSPPHRNRSNRNAMNFFVNSRPVQDRALTAAVIQAYQTFLMTDRFPVTMLSLTLPPDQVDVNVHPTKAEVRFLDQRWIFTCARQAVRRTVIASSPVPYLLNQVRWDSTDPGHSASGKWGGFPTASSAQNADETIDTRTIESYPTFPGQPPLPTYVPLLRLLGQIGRMYIVAEGPDGLYLVDQHAAHERVLFERFLKEQETTIPSQSLLQPAMLELPLESAAFLEEFLPVIRRIGFQVENFGPGIYAIRSIPALFSKHDPVMLLTGLVDEFDENESQLENQKEARIIARVCKRAAIKGGQQLSIEEQTALLRDLENCESPRTCPHGRPTMMHLSVELLARQFGRKEP